MTFTPDWDAVSVAAFPPPALPAPATSESATPAPVTSAPVTPASPSEIVQSIIDWHALGLNEDAIARITGLPEGTIDAIAGEYPTAWENATIDAHNKLLGLMYKFASGQERANSGQLSYLHDMLGYLGELMNASDGTDSIVGYTDDSDDDS